MNPDKITPLLRIKTAFNLGSTGGMMIGKKYLDARAPNKTGTVYGHVPGHGGDVWWVKHDDGAEAAYMFDEFEPEAAAQKPADDAPATQSISNRKKWRL